MSQKQPFKKIERVGIIAKSNIGQYEDVIRAILKIYKSQGLEIYYDVHVAGIDNSDEHYTRSKIMKKVQFVVVFGGDGTLLSIARELPKSVVHVLSVNAGTLGFLTEIKTDKAVEAVEQVLAGEYIVDSRFMLRVTNYDEQGKKICTHLALNDAVISQGAKARLIELPVEINQRQVNKYQADGLIIATPTGSTGHSLSAGGPIVHPKLDAIVISPICPLSLSNRPIVVPNDRQITVTVETFRDQHESVTLTIDGQVSLPVHYHTQIKIRRSSRKLHLVRLTGGDSYYRKLRGKLNWR